MAKYDDFQNVHSVVGLSGSAIGVTVSPGLDTKAMEQVTVILQAGVAIATGTLDVVVQDSADNSSFADLTGAVFTQMTDTDDNVIMMGKIRTNHVDVRRYLRIEATVGTAVVEYGCLLIGSNLSGHIPYTTNALPAPVFNIANP